MFLLILIDIAVNLKNRKSYRFKPRELVAQESFFTGKIRAFIDGNSYLRQANAKYINKLCLINNLSEKENSRNIEIYLFIALIIAFSVGLFSLKIFSIWYMIIILFVLTIFMVIYIGIMYISFKINKIYSYFPLAIQLFTDEYVSYKNIKVALNNSYYKIPNKISKVFENLTRRLSSSTNEDDYKKAINNFADALNFTWGYAFAEVLLLSYDGVGDITGDLIYLNELASEEIKDNIETEVYLNSIKMIFIILNICTIVAFIANMIYVPMSKHLFFYTPTGNFGIIAWLSSIVIGLLTLSIFKYV